jgi:hypothetical protein
MMMPSGSLPFAGWGRVGGRRPPDHDANNIPRRRSSDHQ